MAESTLTLADNNKALELEVGDTVVIRLAENATTGYQWAVSTFSQENVELELAEAPSSAPAGAIGAGGSESVFRFSAKAPGTANVSLKLWRGYERDDSVFKFTVHLNVH